MDIRTYLASSPYCRAIQQNLFEVGVSIRVADVRDGVALITIQQVDHLEYIYNEAELLERATAVCREGTL
ncbi:hypothetical protein [Lewinella sp. IMCC34191]|uniref:hypothetical protein n=1 Tax=Lewinella sp. IMCC34191 TaxID=2259172 RepID=UPI000E245BC2|nr:hypothetical protein [Lewinella sp. IMCC34191]